jgi:hypothetical protein
MSTSETPQIPVKRHRGRPKKVVPQPEAAAPIAEVVQSFEVEEAPKAEKKPEKDIILPSDFEVEGALDPEEPPLTEPDPDEFATLESDEMCDLLIRGKYLSALRADAKARNLTLQENVQQILDWAIESECGTKPTLNEPF